MIYKTLHRKLKINPHEQPLKTGDEHRCSGRVGSKTVRFRPIPEINLLCTSISVTHVSKSVQPSFSLQGVSIYFWVSKSSYLWEWTAIIYIILHPIRGRNALHCQSSNNVLCTFYFTGRNILMCMLCSICILL